MGRHSCCYKQKLRKGLWSPEEDEKLIKHITKYGHGCWSSVPKLAGLQRCGKSCRLRWINYLRPDLKRGTFSTHEEDLIIELHAHLGNKWSQIAAQLPGRTDNEIKNLWNSSIKKKLRQRGIDPNTHKPLSEVENGEEKPSAKNNNNNDKASEDSYELNFIEPENSNQEMAVEKPKPPPPSMAAATQYPPTHEFFLNRFVTSHETSTTTKPSDLASYLSFEQLNYSQPDLGLSVNPNTSNLFFNPNTSNSNLVSSILPSISNSILNAPTRIRPLPCDHHDHPMGSFHLNRLQNWDTNSGSSNNGSSTNSIQYFDNNNSNAYCWGASEIGKLEKEAQIHSVGGETEEIKWTEYLQTPFLLGNAIQNHTAHDIYHSHETKPETQFSPNSQWHHQGQQQQQPLHGSADVYTKHFQRLSATFGHFS